MIWRRIAAAASLARMREESGFLGARVSRRGLLLGAVGTLALPAGCSAGTAPPPAAAPRTIASVTSQTPFYIAHRGGQRNWPEMTAYAYGQATSLPFVEAIEISVCATADGVLVCSHDPTTTRVTGLDYEIAKQPWSTLEPLMVTSRFTEDPSQPSRPLTRLDEVLELYLSKYVVFIEAKTAPALPPLKALLVALNQPARTVWKHPINSGHFEWAKEQGFGTWGYALDEPAHSMDKVRALAAEPRIDMLGVHWSRSDEVLTEFAAIAQSFNKKVIMWSLETPEQRARALKFGASGLMTADIKGLPLLPIASDRSPS